MKWFVYELYVITLSDSKIPKRQNGGLADRIIAIISSDKTITVVEISGILNVLKRTVEREIKNLRERGMIARKGGRRYGYWEIM